MKKTGATITLTTGAHNWESRRRDQRSSMGSAARYHQCERHDRGSVDRRQRRRRHSHGRQWSQHLLVWRGNCGFQPLINQSDKAPPPRQSLVGFATQHRCQPARCRHVDAETNRTDELIRCRLFSRTRRSAARWRRGLTQTAFRLVRTSLPAGLIPPARRGI